tara:strand:- start:158 stop:838 length:681 start_codon:yes stop_codon:yes gene_type:complete
MIKVLELFSGTRSIGKVCDELGWESVSVDLMSEATHKCDIMEFDYKQYPKDTFDLIWASPPCTNYSKLQDCFLGRKRKGQIYTKEIQEAEMKEDDKLVLRTLEIIDYFNPEYYFIENPATSKMKDRDYMKDRPFYIVDYCMYSDYGYRKRTRIWTNKEGWDAKKCDGSGACGNMIDKLHASNCGNSERLRRARHRLQAQGRGDNNTTTQADRYRVPPDLVFSLFLE